MDYQPKPYPYTNNLPPRQDQPYQAPYNPNQKTQQPQQQYQPYQPLPNQPYQPPQNQQQYIPPLPTPPTVDNVLEQSYIENIMRLNKGKLGTFYFTYTDSNEWRDRVYKGIIEAAGRDHLIISDPKTGKRYLLQLIYFNWAEFDGEIDYSYPFR